MKSNYRKAIIVGSLIGLYALVAAALHPAIFELNSSLEIPFWDKRITGYELHMPTLTLGLELQAVFLRFCTLLIENGFWYFMVPIGLSCSFVKLSDIGRTKFFARLLLRSIKLTGLILGGLCLLALILMSIIMVSAQTWEMVIPGLFLMIPCLVVIAVKIPLIPPIWIISFLTEWWILSGKWKTLRENSSGSDH